MNGSTVLVKQDSGSDDNGIFHLDEFEPETYTGDPAYSRLITQYGLAPEVAAEYCEIIKAGIFRLEDMDERTLEFSKTQKPEQVRHVLNQFRKSNLMGVLHPVPYLGSLLRNFKERSKSLGVEIAKTQPIYFAPKAENLQTLLDRTQYPVEVTVGQRKYGPPPTYEGPKPGAGCEIYIGRIPKDMYEDELVPLMEKYGTIYDLRVMMDPVTGQSKGYGFGVFMQKPEASLAAKNLEDYEVKPGKKLRCNVSIANTRLFIGNIPKSKSKEEIMKELSSAADLEGIIDVIIYPDSEDPINKKNCGYCFVEFEDHKSASTAKRKLVDGNVKPWNLNTVVNWAEPQEEPEDDVMTKVRTVFVKNLREAASEEAVLKAFSVFGDVSKVRRVKDYAFVFYNDRDHALQAIEKLHKKEFMGSIVEVSLARPQSEARKKVVQARAREGMTPYGYGAGSMGGYGYPPAVGDPYAGYMPYPGYGYPVAGGPPHGGMGMGGSPMVRGVAPMRARASPTMAAQYRMGRGGLAAASDYGMYPYAEPPSMIPTRGGATGMMGFPMKRPMNGGGYRGGAPAKRRGF